MASKSNNELHKVKINGSDGKSAWVKVDGPTLEALRRKDPAVTALVLQAIGDPKTKDDTDTAYLEEATDEADEQVASTSTNTSTEPKWTTEAENALMDWYRESEKTPLKNKWGKIAQKMKDAGFPFSPEQCRLKIKYLKEKISRITKQRATSGNGTPDTGISNEMEEKMLLTFSTPDCKPVYITESDKKTDQPNDEEDDLPPAKKNKKTVAEILAKTEEDAERRHQERMGVLKGFLELMSNVLKKD